MSKTLPERPPLSPGHASQRGFAIVAAIFILVVLASLGAYMVTISSAHHVGSALAIEETRAHQAARSGMDWGIGRVVVSPAAFGAGSCQPGPASINLTTGTGGDLPGLAGYTVTVDCQGYPFTDGDSLHIYVLTATACNQPDGTGRCPNTSSPGANYVERQLVTQVTCPPGETC